MQLLFFLLLFWLHHARCSIHNAAYRAAPSLSDNVQCRKNNSIHFVNNKTFLAGKKSLFYNYQFCHSNLMDQFVYSNSLIKVTDNSRTLATTPLLISGTAWVETLTPPSIRFPSLSFQSSCNSNYIDAQIYRALHSSQNIDWGWRRSQIHKAKNHKGNLPKRWETD